MANKMVKNLIGDFKEKKEYKRLMKRAKALPKEYRYAFKKMQKYIYNFGGAIGGIEIFRELVELLEDLAREGKSVVEATGGDIAGFCDELVKGDRNWIEKYRRKLNKNIEKKFRKFQ